MPLKIAGGPKLPWQSDNRVVETTGSRSHGRISREKVDVHADKFPRLSFYFMAISQALGSVDWAGKKELQCKLQ